MSSTSLRHFSSLDDCLSKDRRSTDCQHETSSYIVSRIRCYSQRSAVGHVPAPLPAREGAQEGVRRMYFPIVGLIFLRIFDHYYMMARFSRIARPLNEAGPSVSPFASYTSPIPSLMASPKASPHASQGTDFEDPNAELDEQNTESEER